MLAVLLLRGPQTPGELKGRTERIVQWRSLEQVDEVLGELIERGYVQRLERRPGQKEERFLQLLGGAPDGSGPPEGSAPMAPAASSDAAPVTTPMSEPTAAQTPSAAGAETAGDALVARLSDLEARVDELAALLEQLTGESL